MHRALAVVLWWLSMVLPPAAAQAQVELKALVGGAVSEPVAEVGEAWARGSKNTFVYVRDTTGGLQKRLASGEPADVIVLAAPGMDALQKENRIVAGSRIDLARALIGVAVKAGAPAPDLSTVDAFKAALLKARSLSYVSPSAGGTSGTYIDGLLRTLGIADAMKSKIVYRTQGSEVADAVAAGEAELGISFTSELQPNKGVRVAGTLPKEIQLPTIYVGAVVATSRNADAARAFLQRMTSAEGRAAFAKAGLEPVGR
ncbi:MAG: molybdate ABC transporter substrate-binding protein [Acidobacteria bacterium]|nr:molybdate ABC transporter substrate-binding protein [Acidobacteriota bacterium]